MKKTLVLLLVLLCLCTTACSIERIRDDEPQKPDISDVISEEPTRAEIAKNRTAELKQQSYERMLGKDETSFATEDSFDMGLFIETCGAQWTFNSLGDIIITPIDYDAESDFRIQILCTKNGFISGDLIYIGNRGDGSWDNFTEHGDPTDFVMKTSIGEHEYQIGFDELDYIYRQLRLLTSPADKQAELNELIDAEIAAYYAYPDGEEIDDFDMYE